MNTIKDAAGVPPALINTRTTTNVAVDAAKTGDRMADATESVDVANQAVTQERSAARETEFAQIEDAVAKVNERAAKLQSPPQLLFEPNDDLGVVVIKVVDRETGEVIRQLPPEAIIESSNGANDQLPALLSESI